MSPSLLQRSTSLPPLWDFGTKSKNPRVQSLGLKQGAERRPFRLWGNTRSSGNFPGPGRGLFQAPCIKGTRGAPEPQTELQSLQPATALQTPATLLLSTMAPATSPLLRASLLLLLLLLATRHQVTGRTRHCCPWRRLAGFSRQQFR